MAGMDKLSNWDKWSQEEKDLLILQRSLSPYVGGTKRQMLLLKRSVKAPGRRKHHGGNRTEPAEDIRAPLRKVPRSGCGSARALTGMGA